MDRHSLPFALLLFFITITPGLASEPEVHSFATPANIEQPLPAISIIIDDLGEQLTTGERAVALPGDITYAFLPHTSHTRLLAELAHRHDKEIMLHMPMQAVGENELGEGGLTLDMSRQRFIEALIESINAVPHISGINNHMGSLLTQHPGHMHWLMEALQQRNDLFFVDSRTTDRTVAYQIATEYEIPRINRNIFLDNVRSELEISKQFEQLVALAKRNGTAVAIGHPYPETIAFLEKVLPTLEQRGIELIRTSNIIKRKQLIEVTIPQAMFAARTTPDKADAKGNPHQSLRDSGAPQPATIQ